MTATVHAHHETPNSVPAVGQLVITVNTDKQVIRDPAGNLVFQGPATIGLIDGEATFTLPPSDDDTLEPSGFTFTLTEQLKHVARENYRTVDFQTVDGATIHTGDLSSTGEVAEDPSYGSDLNTLTSRVAALEEGGGVSPSDASATVKGIVELATILEATTGTDTVRAVTPAGVSAAIAAAGVGGARTDILVPADRTGLRAGLKAIIDGTRDAHFLFIGDSTIYGVGSTDKSAPNDSFPTQLIGLLDDATGYAVGEGFVRPPDTGYGFTDSRWTFGTGWTAPSTNVAAGASATSGASGALSFVPGETGDTVEILYAQNASQGSAVVKNGATTIGTINATGSNLLAKATFTFTAGAPTINVQGPTGGGFVLYAIRVTNSAARKIRVTNGAKPGTKVADYDDNSFTATGNLADTIDPDVIFIGLNKNDGTQGTTFSTWKAGIVTLITRYQTAGNTVVLLMETPSSPSSYSGIAAREDLEAAALRQMAGAYGCGFIDMRDPFGSFSVANGAGLYDDGIHPSTAGYAVNAQQVADWATLAVAP